MTSMILATIVFFFFNDTATTEIYTLSLHDALPIYQARERLKDRGFTDQQIREWAETYIAEEGSAHSRIRSEEHTSELQSLAYLVCRLLLEKKKPLTHPTIHSSQSLTACELFHSRAS